MTDVLWQDGSQSICLQRNPTEGFVNLVRGTAFVSGRRPYRRLNLREQLDRLEQPVFLTAEHKGKTVGTYVLNEHSMRVGQTPHCGFYRGMLCVDPEYRGAGVSQRLVQSAKHWMRARSATAGKPGLSWGCIAADNTAARRLLKRSGHTEIGALSTRLEYQQWLTADKFAVALDQPTPELAARWQEIADKAHWRLESPPSGCWMLVKDGREWIACCHHVTVLDLTPLSGMLGWIDRHLMSRFAPGRRRFDPSRFGYVSVTQRLASSNGQRLWKTLRNALMVRHETHFVNVVAPVSAHRNNARTSDIVVSAARLEDNPRSMPDGQIMLWPPDM